MRHFPLQNKKLQRLTLPYAQVGVCEVMNTSPYYLMDSFNVYNAKNKGVYMDVNLNEGSNTHSCNRLTSMFGEMIGGGLMDSYTGATVSRFIAHYMAKSLSMHTIIPSELAKLRKERPDDLMIQVMVTSMHRNQALQQGGVDRNKPPYSSKVFPPRNSCSSSQRRSVITEWDSQQYAICADAAFLKCCHILQKIELLQDKAQASELFSRFKRNTCEFLTGMSESETKLLAFLMDDIKERSCEKMPQWADVLESGCSGVWFTATVSPFELRKQRKWFKAHTRRDTGLAPPPQKYLPKQEESFKTNLNEAPEGGDRVARQPSYCLDLLVSNIGSSRAFGIARNHSAKDHRNFHDNTNACIVPLSIDHSPLEREERRRITSAGGKVFTENGGTIDGNPFLTVSRSFGHWSMKKDPQRSPVHQKIIPLPSTTSWEMLEGDILVLSNHALYETRHDDDSSMDEIAKVASRAVDRGLSPEQVAATLCDFAIRFGADHSLQVMVVIATDLVQGLSKFGGASQPFVPDFVEYVDPGPVYIEACRRIPGYKEALQRDCIRCGVSLKQLLKLRWERVRGLLEQRHVLPLHAYYGKECSVLQQIMDEEANLFSELTHNDAALSEEDIFRRIENDLIACDKTRP